MLTHGNLLGAKVATAAAINFVRVLKLTVAEPCLLVKVTVALNTLAGTGNALLRPVVYTATGSLTGTIAAYGDEVTIEPGRAFGWVDLAFTRAPTLIQPGDYFIGLHQGGAALNLYQATATGGESPRHDLAGTYTSLPPTSPTFPAASATTLAMYLTCALPWVAPDANDTYLASLPHHEAVEALAATAVAPDTLALATCGWHGTATDPQRGQYALVNRDGPLADLVGERLRVSTSDRYTTYVYVTGEADLLDDLSLSRQAFSDLDSLAEDAIDVVVEVLS